MKKALIGLLLLCLLLPTAALAMTQEEWNLSCNKKTLAPTTVYKIGTDNEFQEVIPANTYVQIYDSIFDMKKIRFMINGQLRTGKVKGDNLFFCVSSVRGSNGLADNVHELNPNHDEILSSSVVITVAESQLLDANKDYSGLNYANELAEFHAAEMAAQRGSIPAESGAAPGAGEQAKEKAPPSSGRNDREERPSAPAARKPEAAPESTQNGVPVKLVELGVALSKVSYNGQVIEIETEKLSFGGDVPADKKIAVVYAPRTGKASLRFKPSTSADVIRKCKAGRIVSVLEYGRKFCKINDRGSVGYILTSCLQFHDPSQQPLGTAVLTYNGKATGRTTINIRNKADGSSAKIAEWKTGTEVLICGRENGWYEIEANGLRGFVMDDFLTPVKP